jgi:hypothetical protein
MAWVDRPAYDRKAWAGVVRYEPGTAVKSRLFLPAQAGKEQGHNEPSRPHKALDV